MDINLEVLFEKPDKNLNALLIIEPLAPLSMVSSMPGAFYSTLREPSKFHICGAFENVLGWHFDENFKNQHVNAVGESKKNIRSQIKKRVEKHLKKLDKNIELKWAISEVGYEPLLEHLFDLGLIAKPPMIVYKDLWKQMRKRSDGYSHPNGTMNLSHEIIHRKMDLERTDNKGTTTNPAITKFFEENRDKYPMYYTSVSSREFISITEGSFKIGLKMNEKLYVEIEKALQENNLVYLGTNEGWVNLKIQKL